MGRAERAVGTNSARSGERSKKIGLVRTKRKKRKRDLEELHRNVLEAKRNARNGASQRDIKWKTNFAKVLANFADKRLDNEDADRVSRDVKSKRKKAKKVCERLLPLPMVGLYENGAKGREIRRAVGHLNETSVARLRGDVLKLLKGDETSAKSTWERREKAADEGLKKKGGNPDRPSDDDSDDSAASRNKTVNCALVKDHPPLRNTKCVKRMNPDETRITDAREEARKDEARELSRQRDEDKCRRRLFESDERETIAKNSFEFIDRAIITDREIRFSPSKTTRPVVVQKMGNLIDDRVNKTRDKNEKHRRENVIVPESDFMIDDTQSADNFWGWSPASCYERLCAVISIDNFENRPHHRYGLSDPVDKIQKILRGIFAENSLRHRENSKKSSIKSDESGDDKIDWESMRTNDDQEANEEETEVIQACTEDHSEMDQCSSPQSTVTMIGSWNQENIDRYGSNEESSVFETKNQGTKGYRRSWKNEMAKMNVEEPTNENEMRELFSSNDEVDRTNESVSRFFKQFKCHNSLNAGETRTFEMEIDENCRASGNEGEKLNFPLETLSRTKISTDNPKYGFRRNNAKHVPTILRRSNDHSANVETTRAKNPNPGKSCEVWKSLDDNDNSSLFSLRNFPAVPREIRSRGERAVPPCPDAILRESKKSRYGNGNHDNGEETVNERRRLELRGNREPEINAERAFAKTCEVRNGRNFFIPRENPEVVDFRTELSKHGDESNGCGITRDNESFINERFFSSVDDDGLRDNEKRAKTNIEGRNSDRDSDAKARKTLAELSREAQLDNPRDGEKFSSFEFTHPKIDPRIRRFNGPKDNTGRRLSPDDPEAPQLPVLRGRNTIESLMRTANIGTTNKPAFRCLPEMVPETGGFRYTETEYRTSVKSRDARRRLEAAGNLRRTIKSSRPNEGTDATLAEQHRGVIGKPVVLFRPIEPGRRRTTQHPHAIRDPRNNDNPKPTIADDNSAQRLSRNLDHHPDFHSIPQRFSSSERNQMPIGDSSDETSLRSFESCTQPAKFLACEQADGENPRRIPIYGKFSVTNVSNADGSDASTFLTIIDEKSDSGTVYTRVNHVAGPVGTRTLDDQLIERLPTNTMIRRNYLPDDDSKMHSRSTSDVAMREQQHSRRVALMVPRPPSSLRHRRSHVTSCNLAPNVESMGNAIPAARIVCSLTDCRTLQQVGQSRGVRMPVTGNREQGRPRYDPCVGHFDNGNPEIIGNVTERIRLPDGRIGVLLAGNSTLVDRQLRFDHENPRNNDQTESNFRTGYVYKLAGNERAIYDPSDHRWKAVRKFCSSHAGFCILARQTSPVNDAF